MTPLGPFMFFLFVSTDYESPVDLHCYMTVGPTEPWGRLFGSLGYHAHFRIYDYFQKMSAIVVCVICHALNYDIGNEIEEDVWLRTLLGSSDRYRIESIIWIMFLWTMSFDGRDSGQSLFFQERIKSGHPGRIIQ